MTPTTAERRLWGSIGGLRVHALHDSREIAGRAAKASETALNTRLLAQIDEARPGLPEVERLKSLDRLRSAHFKSMSAKRLKKMKKASARGRG